VKILNLVRLIVLVFGTQLSSHPALAQFSQQGSKLVGTGAVGPEVYQGESVSVSADGNTAIVGAFLDNGAAGAVWVWTRNGAAWTQQGAKLVGSGAVGNAGQGYSVSVSADGNTAIVGGFYDNSGAGAVWVWTRNGDAWTQQGAKLVGSGAVGSAGQGYSVSVSGDGNTAIIGGFQDDGHAGAAWVWTRNGGAWTQQGAKLVGSGAVGAPHQGVSVSLSADGNTAIVGGNYDNGHAGAAWIWRRSGGVWSQDGNKLVGSGAVGIARQGRSVSLSGDGKTAIVGGNLDSSGVGATWVWTRSGGAWTQQGAKLVGSGAVGAPHQGVSVSLSGDGNTAIVGGFYDNAGTGSVWTGAAWVWTRSGGVWTQQGNKLVGSGAGLGSVQQGYSVSLSADGNTAIVGGPEDNDKAGAAWVFTASAPTGVLPTITTPPANQAVTAGANATFKVTASGTPAPTLQWQVSANGGSSWSDLANNNLYSGVTTGTLSITGATIALNAYQYRCVARNSSGSANSTASVLTVKAAFLGTVVAWGHNGSGETAGLSGVAAIAAGYLYTVALKGDGKVVAWGFNESGATNVPAGLNGVTEIAAGWYHIVALKSDGTVVAWGKNNFGQTTVPADLSGVVAIAAGQGHTVALKSDGTVVAWGRNQNGETTVPAGLSGVTAIAAGSFHTVALKSDGTVVAWGENRLGQMIMPAGLSGVAAIAAGQGHTVALKSDGTVVAWGYNSNGQTNVPAGLSAVTAIAGGVYHTVALKGDGRVVAWGWKGDGQTTVPAGLSGVMAIAAGVGHTVALVAVPVSPATVNHVLVSQRPGTTLVDLFYDLSGAGSGYSVAVAVSADGGVSFTVPATHFTGDGVTSPAAPGASHHIVWDAGADFPGQFSTRMRIKVVTGSATAHSPIFTLDTRSVISGSVFGRVFGSGAALSDAQVRVVDTPFTTVTGEGGGFNITGIPSGVGYVVGVAAPGFAPANIANVAATAPPRDLGVITLRPLGAHKVIPLVPDLNPAISKVEEGGVAYRYYRVVSADGKTPAGKVTLQARLAGGANITQTGDVAENWPGREAGVSDADGIVRIRVPSSAVGSAATTRKVEVLDAEQVVQSFDVRIVSFKHEKVWGHILDSSVAGKLGTVRLEPGGMLETQIKDFYIGTTAKEQTIERTRSLTGKAGVSASVGSLKLGSVKVGAKKGAGGYMNLQWSGKWRFDQDEQNGILNWEKVYFAFGDIIFLGPLGAEFFGKLSDYFSGAGLQDSLMVGSGGEMHLGGYFDGEAGFGIGNIGNVNVRAGAELDGDVGGFLGYERSYSGGQIQEDIRVFGFESELQRGFGATAASTKFNGNRLRGLGGGLHWGSRNTLSARVRTDWNTKRVNASSVTIENEISSGGDIRFFGWKGVEAPVAGDEKVKLSETYTLNFSEANSFGKVAALGKLWDAVRPGSTTTPLINNRGVDETTAALAGAAEESGSWTTYERSIHRTYQGEFTFPIGANTLAADLELDFTAQAERGAAMVLERGAAPGGRLFPQEYQPDQSRALIPADKIYDKELVWLSRAEFPPTSGFSRFAEYVSTANPNLTIGGRFSMFFHDVADGAKIVGSDFMRLFGGDSPAPQRKGLQQMGTLPGALPQAYQPAHDQTNYVYGVSGILQLTPGTNAFPGTVTLVMNYADGQIAGLNEADLRIYRLPEATNQWQLVGGIVNVVSNSVTTVISNFGTYAISPPMPSGNVNLQAANLNLIANGTNELMLVATNLLLNTAGIATDAWLFTVDAVAIELLDADLTTDWPGVQVASSNGVLQLRLRAPVGGTYASVSASSVVGDAHGHVGINLIDAVPPVAPANVLALAGQSRVWVTWKTNSEPDIAGYRVYYSTGTVGPPWDGTAAVEGTESPVSVIGTNCLLRGLVTGTNYFVSVATVDTTGNESALAPAINVSTSQQPPNPPTGVAARFGVDGTNVLMWRLSEDDGYNDRDVIHYDVWRVVMPGTNWRKVGEVEAGIGLFSETNLTVGAKQYVRYGVAAVDQLGATSALILANRFVTGTPSVDNDGDDMADDWEMQYGLGAENPADAHVDADGDRLTNVQEYLLGRNPLVPDPLRLSSPMISTNGVFSMIVEEVLGRSVTLKASLDMTNWLTVTNYSGNNAVIYFQDARASSRQQFYRATVP
jgi:hypothetical protein